MSWSSPGTECLNKSRRSSRSKSRNGRAERVALLATSGMSVFIEGFEITQTKLAVAIGVPPRRITEIVHGKRGITADAAIRLARYFGNSEEFWMNLQSNYELRLQRRVLSEKVAEITPLEMA